MCDPILSDRIVGQAAEGDGVGGGGGLAAEGRLYPLLGVFRVAMSP